MSFEEDWDSEPTTVTTNFNKENASSFSASSFGEGKMTRIGRGRGRFSSANSGFKSNGFGNAGGFNNGGFGSSADNFKDDDFSSNGFGDSSGGGFENNHGFGTFDSNSYKKNNGDWNSSEHGSNKPRSNGRFKSDHEEYRPRGGGRNRGGSRGRGFNSGQEDRRDFRNNNFRGDGDGDGDGERRERAPLYIPPPPPDDEVEMFESMQRGINFGKYDSIPVEVTGVDPPQCINSFESAKLTDTIRENVRKAKYERPTPVQKYSIPIISAGRDLMACAQTGSGKTAAFLLPVLSRMIKSGLESSSFSEKQTPQAIIVGPTRELVNQIFFEARKFARGTVCRPCVAYGGTSVGHQLREIERGCHMLIATPGRLMDFINKGKVGLSNVQFVILDEADRMLDMGFESEIRRLVDSPGMPPKTSRQTLMFSATFPDEIQKLAHDFLREDFLFLTVGRVGGACTDVTQTIVQIDQSDKREKLLELVADVNETRSRTLVFVETKRSADFLACSLSQEDYPTTSIHGDRLQQEREEALRDFKKGTCPIMIATSVAARGLDIPKVEHVINYDLPKDIDEYVHRIGRTGRCGNLGRATSFYDNNKDSEMARSLIKILSESLQEVPSWLEGCAESAVGTSFGVDRGAFGGRDARSAGRRKGRSNNQGFGGDGGFGSNDANGDDFGSGFGSRTTGDYDYNDGGGFGGTSTSAGFGEEEW